ncbi:nitrogen regulatory protein P-II homolog [Amaranthus tricolor]|uniref:nitrogen regulatory protein P-II homolog n=1 Tax=Amaranthus tricolor TaxID=29722 RepID=UPI00258B18FC|nr:nitrogen regulatory protein P-II homolog [Amaranthus tricolor]
MAVNMAPTRTAVLGIMTGPFNCPFSSKNSNLGHGNHSHNYFSRIPPKFGFCKPLHLNASSNRSRQLPTFPQIKAQMASEHVPDFKFYKVEAILRPWRIQKVSAALLKMGIRGVTVSDVRGFGAQGGSAERHAGSEFFEDKFVSKVKMEIVVSKDQVDAVVDLIIQAARTGEIGDGKIFVLPVSDIIRVRTGERGLQAERMSGGWYDMSN